LRGSHDERTVPGRSHWGVSCLLVLITRRVQQFFANDGDIRRSLDAKFDPFSFHRQHREHNYSREHNPFPNFSS
jgi:hypothetical protein